MKGAELNIFCNDNGTEVRRPINISVLIRIMVVVAPMMVVIVIAMVVMMVIEMMMMVMMVMMMMMIVVEGIGKTVIVGQLISRSVLSLSLSKGWLADILMKDSCGRTSTCQLTQPTNRF